MARKLALRPVEIVNYLALKSIIIDSGGNTRLEDEHVNVILQKFAPNGLPEDVVTVADEEPKIEIVQPDEPVVEKSLVNIEIPEPEIKEEEKIEVIKAPKIELSGLKVLGKIELPEPKKKEPAVIVEEPSSLAPPPAIAQEPRPEKRIPYTQRRERPNQAQRPAKNPIALQREREAREAEEKRKALIELEKEKRTLHYLKKVNVTQPTKAVKVVEERVVEKPVVPAPVPKTLWGKFKRWMSS